MKYKLDIRAIQSDHPFAIPTTVRTEFVEANSMDEVDAYIKTLKDSHGNHFEKANSRRKKMFGIDYISSVGSIKIKKLKFKKI